MTEGNGIQKFTRDEFRETHIADKTEREILADIAWHTYLYGCHVLELKREVKELRDYVERIEKEAQDQINAFSDPSKMADLARDFLKGS